MLARQHVIALMYYVEFKPELQDDPMPGNDSLSKGVTSNDPTNRNW